MSNFVRGLGSRKWFQVGDVIGNLTIMRLATPSPCGVKRWVVQCVCGIEEVKGTANIRRSSRIGTGCSKCGARQKAEKKTTHGESNSPLHKAWSRMRYRCYGARCTQRQWYGGKGVIVCKEWDDFTVFRDWALSHGYVPGLTIDRMDPAGNYEPSNCRWLTHSENSRLAREYHNAN